MKRGVIVGVFVLLVLFLLNTLSYFCISIERFSNTTAHLGFSGDADNYASQKLTKISRVNVNGIHLYSKASIDVSNIIAMTVIDNNTVYLIDFSQKAYRVSFLLDRNEFGSMANNITPITLPTPQRVMKIVKSYRNDGNEVFFLSNHGNIYKQNGSTQIGNATIQGIDFVDIATSGSLPNTIMGVTKEGRLLAIDIGSDTGAITHNVTNTIIESSTYDNDPSDDGNTFLYTQVEGNKDSSTQYPFVAIRTDTNSKVNSMVALQKSGSSGFNQSLIIITGSPHNDLLELSIKVYLHEDDIFIYKLTSYDFVNKSAYRFKIGDSTVYNLFITTNTNTLAFTVSNTGRAYHFTNNDLYEKKTDDTFDTSIFDAINVRTDVGVSYLTLGAYGDDHIFLLTKGEIQRYGIGNIQEDEEETVITYVKPLNYENSPFDPSTRNCAPEYTPITTEEECRTAATNLNQSFGNPGYFGTRYNKCFIATNYDTPLTTNQWMYFNTHGSDEKKTNDSHKTPICRHESTTTGGGGGIPSSLS
jgi:hypothetical protein